MMHAGVQAHARVLNSVLVLTEPARLLTSAPLMHLHDLFADSFGAIKSESIETRGEKLCACVRVCGGGSVSGTAGGG